MQHCQLTTAAQYRRMARLGMCANIFANHLWFWGDEHHDMTVGPERARRMEAAATADARACRSPCTAMRTSHRSGSCTSMWCAVNRITPSGRVLGQHERISPASALRAVTLGSAHQLHLDGEFGTIECGKAADLTILDDDPLAVDPLAIRDIGVWGTVVGGIPFPANRPRTS